MSNKNSDVRYVVFIAALVIIFIGFLGYSKGHYGDKGYRLCMNLARYVDNSIADRSNTSDNGEVMKACVETYTNYHFAPKVVEVK